MSVLLMLLACDDGRSEVSFAATPADVVDVLWVIDDSASMGDQQTRLAEKPATWFYAFDSVDLHMGAVTTSAWTDDAERAIVWGDADCPETAACYSAWAAALAPGIEGSDLEAGLGSALVALAPPAGDTTSADFLRDNSLRVVAVVSNDDDCTGDLGAEAVSDDCYSRSDALEPVDELLNSLMDLDRGGRLQVAGMVGTTETCADVTYAPRYGDAIALTGGAAVDLCKETVADSLDAIAGSALGVPDRFVLPEAVDPTSLTVKVGGDEVSNDLEGGWTYDNSLWMLTFHGLSVPGDGDEVVVRYSPG